MASEQRTVLGEPEGRAYIEEVTAEAQADGGFLAIEVGEVDGVFLPRRAKLIAAIEDDVLTYCLTIEDRSWLLRGDDLYEAIGRAVKEAPR